MSDLIVLRGGGDLASGIALRLYRSGFHIVITELEKPLAVRRSVSYSEAVYDGVHTVEGITARLVSSDQIQVTIATGEIPVLIDPKANILSLTNPRSTFVVDARMIKSASAPLDVNIPLHIGLGPGFNAGENCHAVVETRRGHTLGRVYWNGSALADSGEPDGDRRRVLRASHDGILSSDVRIGDHLEENQFIAMIEPDDGSENFSIFSPFKGILRGLIRPGMHVTRGMKVGDVDRRNDPAMCKLVSDKSLAVGGGVLEAVLAFYKMRKGQQ